MVSQALWRYLFFIQLAVFIAVGAAGVATAGAFLAYPEGLAKPLILVIEWALLPSLALTLGLIMAGAPQRPEDR